MSKKSKDISDMTTAHAAGLDVLGKLGWPADSGFADMDPEFWKFTTGHLFGQIWARPGLSLRDRALVTLAVLLAVDADRGSKNHIRYAHNLGITEEEMREVIIQVGYYAGWPKGAHAMARFSAILNEPDSGWARLKKAREAKEKAGGKAGKAGSAPKKAKAGKSA